MKISRGLQQSYDVQNFCHEALLALRESLTKEGKLKVTREDAQGIRALTQSWKDAQERVSFHRRVPAPSVREKAAMPKRKRPVAGPIEEVSVTITDDRCAAQRLEEYRQRKGGPLCAE
jgi:hypothetical protein